VIDDWKLVVRQAGYQLRTTTRNPRAMVFTVVFPIVLFVLFASIFSKGGEANTRLQGTEIPTDAYFLAGILAYAIMMSAFSTMAIGLTTQRESGLLKRFRGTPVPSWTFLASQVLRSIVLVACSTVALLLIAWVGYAVDIRGTTIVELAAFVVLGTAAMCALGIAITTLTTTADSAATIAPFSTVLLAFISGVFVPTDQLPDSLVQIGKVFPLAHLAEGLQAAFDSGPVHLSGENVAVLGLWGLGGLIFAARHFRWEPRAVGG
jgi:ABC-2 type transport system permease protein